MRIFFSAQPMWTQLGITVVRVVVGLFLVYHGWELFSEVKMKEYHEWEQFKSSAGYAMAYAGKAAEFVAGLLLVLGLFTRIACLLTAGVMLFISFQLGNGIVWYNDQHPFLFVLLAVMLFCSGPGKWSLDAVLFTIHNK